MPRISMTAAYSKPLMRSTFQLPLLADSNSSVMAAWSRALCTATVDSASVVVAISAKIA